MKATLITGASGGIGEALAKKLAARKHNLVLVARNETKLKMLAGQLVQLYGVAVVYIAADLSKPDAAMEVFEQTKGRNLNIDVLINNAGIGSGGEFATLTLQAELDMLQLNITSLVALTHLYLQDMKRLNRGTIINVASLASFMPIPYMSSYSASKVFVRHFTQALTQEAKAYSVDVMLLCPGLTKTNFNAAAGIENQVGKGLNAEYSETTQSPEQVADELLAAMDKRQHYVVSGRMNRLAARLSALLPNAFLARIFAGSYRKRLGI